MIVSQNVRPVSVECLQIPRKLHQIHSSVTIFTVNFFHHCVSDYSDRSCFETVSPVKRLCDFIAVDAGPYLTVVLIH